MYDGRRKKKGHAFLGRDLLIYVEVFITSA
jgi:hypothetical protein